MTRCRSFVRRSGCSVVAAYLLAFPGCRQEQPGPEVISLDGKIEKINRTSDDTGEITVSYYSDKQKTEVSGIGMVTKATEIMINGAIATLKDLRDGERVHGEVRVDKKGGERVLTILKITVNRAQTPTPGEGG